MRYGLIFFGLFILQSLANAQINNAADQIFYLKRVIEKYHIKPTIVDDNFSKILFKDIIDDLDSKKLIFTQSQFATLQKFEYSIDDEINSKKVDFLNALILNFKNQLSNINKIIDELGVQPQNFTIEEKLNKYTNFSESEKVLKERWRLELKANILAAIKNYAINSNSKNKIVDKQWIAEKEIIFRKKEVAKLKSKVALALNPVEGLEASIITLFCEKMALCFDPHTNYFTPFKLQNFSNVLSGGQKIIFGFSLNKNNIGEVIIDELVPGSPAYKSGQLHENDVIQKITLSNQESFNAIDATISEVSEFINKANGTISLTVKKNDGLIKTIVLNQAKVATDEGLVQSFLLKDKINLGYIALPDFYVGTDRFANQGCAADVAKEIIKLKKENVQGLILDLRYNGGGSLEEAIDLAGIFVDDGPLALTKNSYESKVLTIKDNNRGTIYDGPLMVLVNGYSASASEIFASMMQDYNRAYIVGSKTFGKHIGQIILPLDTMGDLNTILSKTSIPKYGYVKVTTSQYNRLNGTTLQCKGIEPQIQLPEVSIFEESESKLPHAITVEFLKKEIVYKPLPILNTSVLNEASKKRMMQDEKMQEIIKKIQQYKIASEKPINLKLANTLMQDEFDLKDLKEQAKLYVVDNTNFYKERIKVNKELEKDNDAIKKFIEQDLYIREAFEIYKNILDIK